MENKAIQNITREDFDGIWISFDQSIKLYVNNTGYLTIGNKVLEGPLSVKYISDCDDCVNCLKLSIGEHEYFIKQIGQNGFYLTVDGGEVFLSKLN